MHGQEQDGRTTDNGKARDYLEEASKDFFFADHLMQPDERIPSLLAEVNRRLGRSATTGEHAPMSRMDVLDSGISFEGDSRLFERWRWSVFSHLHLLRHRSKPSSQ